VKAYMSGRKIDLHVLHPFFLEVFMDVQCTGVAIHSLNPPGNFFHRVKLLIENFN
ncbi:MAG: hypothetical protein RLZZ86_1844, partial [Cyanobacteriota bacterium]